MKAQAFFRADFGPSIGMGHIFRCLCLSSELRRREIQSVYILDKSDRQIEAHLKKSAVKIRYIAPSTDQIADADSSAEYLNQTPASPQIVILDHYGFSREWTDRIRNVAPLLVIDDHSHRDLSADILLNQNTDVTTLYSNLSSAPRHLLMGPSYSLLKSEISEARKPRSKELSKVKNILVSFGGADPTGETLKFVSALEKIRDLNSSITIISGLYNPDSQEIIERAGRVNGVKVINFVPDLTPYLVEADLFIGACGSTTWEWCALALKAIVVQTTVNQKMISEYVNRMRLGLYLGEAQNVGVDTWVATLRNLPNLEQDLWESSKRAFQVTDGTGASRVADVIDQVLAEKFPTYRSSHRNIL